MRTPLLVLACAGVIATSACGGGGTSTREMEAAAIEQARQRLNLPADAPLEAKVWVGLPFDGETVMCGTVSDTAADSGVPAQRFAATPEPLRWLVFEDAHDPMSRSQPDKFVEWASVCGTGTQS